MKKLITIPMILIFMCACVSGPVSLNMQRATARSVGDLGTIMVLDAKYDQITPEKIIKVAEEIKKALEAQSLEELDRAGLIALISSKIDVELIKTWANKMVAMIPENVSPKDGKVIIIDMCDQIILAAGKFDPAGRVVQPAVQ